MGAVQTCHCDNLGTPHESGYLAVTLDSRWFVAGLPFYGCGATDGEGMGDQGHEHLLRKYVHEVWDKRNPDAVSDFLDADYVRHVSPAMPPIGRREQIDRLTSFRAAFPDISITVEDVVVGGDRVAFRSTMRGTQQGAILGVGPTGIQVEVGLLDLWRIADNKVVEQWGGPDIYDLMRQLGAH